MNTQRGIASANSITNCKRDRAIQDCLADLLKEEENKYCADCDAKGPRWASWNIGVFLCIRCAGVHRNLGCHISKIKSINLDTWKVEHLIILKHIGNANSREIYEAHLPPTFRRPHTDSAIETFIRSKYEHKKFVNSTWIPLNPKEKEELVCDLAKQIESKLTQTHSEKKKKNVIRNTIKLGEAAKCDIKSGDAPQPPRISDKSGKAAVKPSTPPDLLSLVDNNNNSKGNENQENVGNTADLLSSILLPSTNQYSSASMMHQTNQEILALFSKSVPNDTKRVLTRSDADHSLLISSQAPYYHSASSLSNPCPLSSLTTSYMSLSSGSSLTNLPKESFQM